MISERPVRRLPCSPDKREWERSSRGGRGGKKTQVLCDKQNVLDLVMDEMLG